MGMENAEQTWNSIVQKDGWNEVLQREEARNTNGTLKEEREYMKRSPASPSEEPPSVEPATAASAEVVPETVPDAAKSVDAHAAASVDAQSRRGRAPLENSQWDKIIAGLDDEE